MDHSALFTGSQTFIDLLNSQQEINITQNHPNNETPISENHSPDKIRESRQRWSLPEEKVLVSAWLNTSKDPIIGTDQKGGAFWDRVAAYYAASPAVANLPLRGTNTCKQKWAKLNESVSKFARYYEFASRQLRSGQTEDDVLEQAYKVYFQDQKVKFTLEHAWRLLRSDQKWCTFYDSKCNPKSKQSDSVSSTDTECPLQEEKEKRPMGVKAAKGKGRKRVKTEASDSSSVKELEDLWCIKQKDLVVKERLANKKLLGDLLCKTTPLSEIEESLKNKLICDML